MKSDNEPAILSLKEEVKANSEVEIVQKNRQHMNPRVMGKLKGKCKQFRNNSEL